MKMKELHDLIKQYSPQVTYLETETEEVAEGECAIWAQDDCTFIIEFANQSNESPALVAILQTISQKLDWLHNQRPKIEQLIVEKENFDTNNAYAVYTAFFVENEREVFCEFAISAPEWSEQVAEFSLESNNELIYQGLEPA